MTFAVEDGISTVEHTAPSQLGVSYSAVLRSIFGIDSEFDMVTEEDFRRFHEAKARLLSGESGARAEVDRVAAELANRSEEVKELIALELAQHYGHDFVGTTKASEKKSRWSHRSVILFAPRGEVNQPVTVCCMGQA